MERSSNYSIEKIIQFKEEFIEWVQGVLNIIQALIYEAIFSIFERLTEEN